MPSKRLKKIKEKPVQVKVPPPSIPDNSESLAEKDPFDFGGLPKRDLKKNLGCG